MSWLARWVAKYVQLPVQVVYKEPLPFDRAKQLIRLMEGKDLSMAERTLCTGALLKNLDALPLHGIITTSDEGILINGQAVDVSKLKVLREAAVVALDNQAFNLIGEQVVWLAIQRGLHNADTPEKLYFYRAAIWFSEQVKEHLQILAQQTGPELLG